MKKIQVWLILWVMMAISVPGSLFANIIYVDNGIGIAVELNGETWSTAFQTIQDAVSSARVNTEHSLFSVRLLILHLCSRFAVS